MWSYIFGVLWLLGAIAYGAHRTKKSGEIGESIGEALLWPLALIVRLTHEEKKED